MLERKVSLANVRVFRIQDSVMRHRWLLAWIPFWFYSFFVIKTAILPASQIPVFFAGLNDKCLHATQYFFLFFFSLNAFGKTKIAWLHNQARLDAFI